MFPLSIGVALPSYGLWGRLKKMNLFIACHLVGRALPPLPSPPIGWTYLYLLGPTDQNEAEVYLKEHNS